MRYQIAIDRGGTFTDAILWDRRTGEERTTKVLSGPESPLTAIRRLLGLTPTSPIPPCDVRLGTTLVTNALLERKGLPTGLLITRGFRDLLHIGTQARPRLFELDIRRAPPLTQAVEDVDARITNDGQVLCRPGRREVDACFARLRAAGVRSLAIAVLFAHRNPELELELGRWAEDHFEAVVLSHQTSREDGFLARASTTVLEAFLGPALGRYLAALEAELPGSKLLVMQSSGGLAQPEALRGPAALLSGPAGGVVAATKIAERLGLERLVTLDMGGTSTDVSVVPLGQELVLESEIGGVTVRAPMVDVRTVAAGGSSICDFDGHALTVGPESVGSTPGPLAFGHPEATHLSLTDVDLLLGRIVPETFPIALARERARSGAAAILKRAHTHAPTWTERELLLGFRAVATAHMAEAIRQVTVARGLDPRSSPLLVFGGAAGQHACAVARALGVRRIVIHRHASVLSALGIGQSDETALEACAAGDRPLETLATSEFERTFAELEARALERLSASAQPSRTERLVLLGYQGTKLALPLPLASPGELRPEFERRHQQKFGFLRPTAPIVVQALRVVARRRAAPCHVNASANSAHPNPAPPKATRVVADDGSEHEVPLLRLPLSSAATEVTGPALLVDETSTIWLEPGFSARQDGDLLFLERVASEPAQLSVPAELSVPGVTSALESAPDPARLEVMAARFMSIAEQMGHALARSAQSTNIRERLDFSCALFDAGGRLIANAPHIPVHLGAMGESVRAALQAFPALAPGDVVVTNDPEAGGSHLPDLTVITPVFSAAPSGEAADATPATPAYFVACRGHHADVGGITPGSMPPHASTLEEEGVLLRPQLAVAKGRFQEAELRAVFGAGQWPARNIEQNLGDLRAQVAANHLGTQLLLELQREVGADVVQAYMRFLLDVSAAKVRAAIAALPPGVHRHELAMDDGTRLRVAVEVLHEAPATPSEFPASGHGASAGSRLVIDFSGTSAEVATNFNAPRAVTRAAVLYFVRTLSDARLPLTDGCLEPVTLIVPEGSVLSPSPGRAVSSGNVETSMQLCDLLLVASGRAAASQGTMNNLTFGDGSFGYYETIAGGVGAGPDYDGASGVHTHMTNTRITDPEVLESRFPVRVRRFELRAGSGGRGRHRGGDGIVRELEALAELHGSIVSERRQLGAPGIAGGGAGLPGRNTLDGRDLGGRASFTWRPGSVLRIETPGGGGYGVPDAGAAAPASSAPASVSEP